MKLLLHILHSLNLSKTNIIKTLQMKNSAEFFCVLNKTDQYSYSDVVSIDTNNLDEI